MKMATIPLLCSRHASCDDQEENNALDLIECEDLPALMHRYAHFVAFGQLCRREW